MKLVIGLLVAASAWAQVSLSTNAISFSQRFQGAGPPYPQAVQITGSGTISIASITSANFNMQSAVQPVLCENTGTSQCVPITNAPTDVNRVLWISWDGVNNNLLAPGTYTATVTITSSTLCTGSCSVVVTLNVAPYTSATFSYGAGGYPHSCASSGSFFAAPYNCTIPQTQPYQFSMPAVGGTYQDANMGSTVTVLTTPSQVQGSWRAIACDAVISCWNSDGSLLATQTSYGAIYMVSPTGGGDVWGPLGTSPVIFNAWDAFNPKVFYYTRDGLNLHKVTLVTAPTTITDQIIYTYPGSGTLLNFGGDSEITADNWWSFQIEGGDPVIGVINLSNPSQVYTRNVSGDTVAAYRPRTTTLSPGINASDNNRYLLFYNGSGFSPDLVYTLPAAGGPIQFAYTMPQMDLAQREGFGHNSYGIPCDTFALTQRPAGGGVPNDGAGSPNCFAGAHSAMVDVNGVEYLVYGQFLGGPFASYPQVLRLDKGALQVGQPAEFGGGMYNPYLITTTSDIHIGCARHNYCAISSDFEPNNVKTACNVTNVTIGANPTVTTASPCSYAVNGGTVAIGGVLNVTGINQICTVANVSGSTFQCTGATTAGTYSCNPQLGCGAVAPNISQPVVTGTNEVNILDLTNVASDQFTVHRVAIARAQGFFGGYLTSSYFGQAHASVSQDGTKVAFQWNNYVPDWNGVAVAPTGISAPAALTVTSPTATQTVSGTIKITSTCAAVPAIYSCEYVVDGESLGLAFSPTGFALTWNSFNFANGPRTIQAIARNANNQVLATSAGVSFQTGNTTTYPSGTATFNATLAVTPSCLTNCVGNISFPLVVGGSWDTTQAWQWSTFVDGNRVDIQPGSPTNPNFTEIVHSAGFYNGSHIVTIMGTQAGGISFVTQYQGIITFLNPSTALVEIRANAREVFLAPGQTFQLSGLVYDATGASHPLASPSYSTSNASVATVNASGLITVSGLGVATITQTSLGLMATTWVFGLASPNIPHFASNGTILSTFVQGSSIWQASMFQNSSGAQGAQYPTYWLDFKHAGFNTMEVSGMQCLPGTQRVAGSCVSANQTQWQASLTSWVASWVSTGLANGTYVHLINDNLWRGDSDIFATTQGTGSAYSPPAITALYTSWANTCAPGPSTPCYGSVIGGTQYDEVNSTYGTLPLAPEPFVFGSSGFTSITISGGIGTVSWNNWSLNGGNNFVITGSSTAALNSVTPVVYHANSTGANSFTFTCAGCPDGFHNSSNDPGLVLERFAFQWHGSAYTLNNAFFTIQGWANAVSGRSPFVWTTAAATNDMADRNWMGDPRMSDYAELYFAQDQQLLSPNHADSFTLLKDLGSRFRQRLANIQPSKPWLAGNMEGIVVNYGFTSPPVAVTSFSGATITFTAAHGVQNVTAGASRVLLAGQSTSGDNGGYWINSILSPTTLYVYKTPTVAVGAGSATFTFSNGDHYTGSIQNISPPKFDINNVANSCVIPRHRGMTFTISGSGTGWDASGTYVYVYNNPTDPGCTSTSLDGLFYLVPSGSSTGGTAAVIADNYFHRGTSISGSSTGPQYVWASHIYPSLLRAAGTRTYNAGIDQQGPQTPSTTVIGSWDPVSGAYNAQAVANNGQFNNYSKFQNGNAIQEGPYALVNYAGEADAWYAAGLADKLATRFLPWVFSVPQPTPDYGQGFEAAVRPGPLGTIVIVQSFWNAPRTLTIDLTPYLGGTITRTYCTWSGCVTSTINGPTDTVTFDPVGTVWYVLGALGWNPPIVQALASDVAGTASISVEWSYSAFELGQPIIQNVVLCGVGPCSIPADPSIGTVYYRVLYLGSAGKLLAVGDTQTL